MHAYIYTLDECGGLDCFGKTTTPLNLTPTQFEVAKQIAPDLGMADAQMFIMMRLRVRYQNGSGPFVVKSETKLTREDMKALLRAGIPKHRCPRDTF